MKKIALLGSVMMFAVFLSGCGRTSTETSGDATLDVQQEVQQPTETKSGTVFTAMDEIKDAMMRGKKLQCTYKMKGADNKQLSEVKFYSQGQKYKSSFEINGDTQNSISDGDVVYNWSEKTKKGTKLDLKCLEEATRDLPDSVPATGETTRSAEEVINDGMDTTCETVSSIDFSIPKDVVFTDSCEDMKKSMEALKDLNVSIPRGVTIPGYGPSSE